MKKKNDMFSVLISVYGKEKPQYLREALNSVLEQTLIPSEVILVEDGKLPKELHEVISEYQKLFPNMKICKLKQNSGLGPALKKGISLCSNELIARMDSDDVANRYRFEQQIRYMESHPEIAVCGGEIEEFDDTGKKYQVKKMPETQQEIMNYAKYRNPINHMTAVFRKKDVLAAGNYREIPLLEDYDLWTRMLKNGSRFYNIQKPLVKMRVSDAMYGRRGGTQYCREYLKLRKRQRAYGLLSGFEYIRSCLQTIAITLLPGELRKKIYKGFLRKNG